MRHAFLKESRFEMIQIVSLFWTVVDLAAAAGKTVIST